MVDAGTEVKNDEGLRCSLIPKPSCKNRRGSGGCRVFCRRQLSRDPAGDDVVDKRIGGWRANFENSADQRAADEKSDWDECIAGWQDGNN